MVQLDFELSSALAATLKERAQNKQKHIDKIVAFALVRHFRGIQANVDLPRKAKVA